MDRSENSSPDYKLIKSILAMLKDGYVIELFQKPDGRINARTVHKKEIKIKQ